MELPEDCIIFGTSGVKRVGPGHEISSPKMCDVLFRVLFRSPLHPKHGQRCLQRSSIENA
jgi:hypothetical protein